MGVLRYLDRLLLALWVGGLSAFAAVVAPALFRVLGPAGAASVVRELIPVAEVFALVAGAALVAITLRVGHPRRRLRLSLLLSMSALAAVSAGVVSPKMAALREGAGAPISGLPKEHPTRRAFGALHGVSNLLVLGQLLGGLAVLALPLTRREDGPVVGPRKVL